LNIDEENPMPIASAKLKSAIDDADGVLIITPEYNRSVPGVLKNAIDWASRPDGGSSWEGKPVAVMGATNGRLGTAAAQMHLKGMLVYLNTRPLGQPEFYQGQIKALLSEDGTNIADEPTRERIAKYLKAFKVHVKNQSV
jgi:chromate reductase